MFVAGTGQIVANPATTAGGGATVVTTGGTANGSGEGAGANGGGGSYVIQGGYMLGGGGGGSNSQSYSHNARASPATVSITEGEESSVPSADKKVCRDANLQNCSYSQSRKREAGAVWGTHTDDVIVEFCHSESTVKVSSCGLSVNTMAQIS